MEDGAAKIGRSISPVKDREPTTPANSSSHTYAATHQQGDEGQEILLAAAVGTVNLGQADYYRKKRSTRTTADFIHHMTRNKTDSSVQGSSSALGDHNEALETAANRVELLQKYLATPKIPFKEEEILVWTTPRREEAEKIRAEQRRVVESPSLPEVSLPMGY